MKDQTPPKLLPLSSSTADGANPAIVTTIGDMSVSEEVYAPGDRQERHAHSHANVSLVLAGSIEETVGRTLEHAFPFSVVVKPGDTEHANQVGTTGARMLSLKLKAEFVESLKDWDPSIRHWRWMHGGPVARSMLRLLQIYRQRHTFLNMELEDCVYEILASLSDSKLPGIGTAPPRWLELVREELDATFAEGVRVRDLAARAEVHPVYLARRFRRHIGYSITEYRTRLKIRAAAELLASSNVPLTAAANQCGFADQSHFGRVFKAASGLTPLDYRQLTNGSLRQTA